MKRVARIILRLLAGAIVLLLIGGMTLYFTLGAVVKKGVETVGPKLTGGTVTVESVSFSAFTGKAVIKGVLVGNPEGFKTPSAFKLQEIRVQVAPGSVFSNNILVKEIYIDGPEVTYEMGLHGSNIGKIQSNIEAATGGGKTTAPPPDQKAPPPAEGGKKIVIEDFLVKNGKLSVSATMLGGHALPVPLPEIHLKDIGKDAGGKSVSEVVSDIMKSVTGVITNSASAAGDVLKKGASEVGSAAAGAGKSIQEGASKTFKSIGGLFKKD